MKIFWTDGSASPNPGPGGYAVLNENGEPVALGRDDNTSNIKMEGRAILNAILLSDEEGVEIHTDSRFWINVLTLWADTWEKNGWRRKTGEIQNLELVKEVYGEYKKHNVKFVFVRGHQGTELNEKADVWANRAREGETI